MRVRGAAMLLLALAACGGTTAAGGASDAGGHDAALDTGTVKHDGGPTARDAPAQDVRAPGLDASPPAPDGGASACPVATPAAGAACGGTVACEYGDDPDVRCDTIMSCAGGTWSVHEAASTTDCATTNPSGCPGAYADLGTTCSTSGLSCAYAEARCGCSSHCGMAGFLSPDGGPELRWCCPDAPPGGSCPTPRPRIGAACSTEGQSCDYGECSGNVGLTCTAGVWVESVGFGCPG